MNKIISILFILFFLFSCTSTTNITENIMIEDNINKFISSNHGTLSIFPTYKYLGKTKDTEGKGIRTYHIWEDNNQGKYIIILQLIPKEGLFPQDLNWTPEEGSLFIKGKRAAYYLISTRLEKHMLSLGANIPMCYILAEEVHVNPKEALFRILIVPDKKCSKYYEPVMQELDRVVIQSFN